MRGSIQVYVAAFWLIFWTVRLFCGNLDWYLKTDDGRLFLLFYCLMILLGAAVLIYFLLKSNGSKVAYKVNSRNRCPDCYAKLKKDVEFCPKCGRDLRPQVTSNTCWNCGYVETDLSVTSCPKCGREFKKE